MGDMDAAVAPPPGDGVEQCPYQGLAPFEADKTALFFGRARATRSLLDRLGPRVRERGSILLVSGASGVGKSSLLRAGMVPALAEGMLPVDGSQRWPCLLITPTSNPARALAEAWTATYGGSVDKVEEWLREDPGAALAGPLAPDGRLVLVVDQFEELFTLVTGEQERQSFVGILHALANGPARAAVVVGLRADYWDRCAAYPQFAEAIQDGQIIVEPMTEADLRLAITGPAAAVGLEIEPGLVETILGDLRADRSPDDRFDPGALPLLSQALRNTWHKRENGRLTIRSYEEAGQVRDSVRRTADEVLQRLPAEDRKIAFKLFRRMTVITPGGRAARRPATLAELHAAAFAPSIPAAERRDRVGALLSAFAGQRLITLHEETVEIAHDALLTAWPALRQWIDPDLTAQTVYEGLIDDAGEWAGHGRDPAYLYRGVRLLSVDDSRPRWENDPASFPPPGPTAEAFLAASTREARRVGRRRRVVMAVLAVSSVLTLIAAVAALAAANDADRQRDLAISRQLAAQSEVADDPVAASLLAVAAWRIAPTSEARHRLLAAAARPGRGTLKGHGSDVRTVVFSPDGKRVATGSEDSTARLWDPATRRQIGAPFAHPKTECSTSGVKAVLGLQGRMLATACLGTVRFWDVAAHRETGAPLDGGGVVSALAFAPDGRTLAIANLKGTVRLYDVTARRWSGAPMGREAPGLIAVNPVHAVVFTPDGKRLATASADRTARLYDTATSKQIGEPFEGHTREVNDVALSPDGTTLATAGGDRTVRLWNMATHRQIGTPLENSQGGAAFHSVAYGPDGTRLATGGSDGATRFWDVTTHQQVGVALDESHFPVRRVTFSPDGRFIAAAGADGVVRLGDPVTYQQIGGAMRGSTTVALSPDGKTLAASGPEGTGTAIRLWDVATRRPIGDPEDTANERPATGRPASGRPVVKRAGIHGIGFSKDGRTVASVGSDGVRTWDTASGRQTGPVAPLGRRMGLVEFSPDGNLLAVQLNDAILFWDVGARRETRPRIRVPGHTEVLSAMAVSPDGNTLATAGFDRKVRVFDIATGRPRGGPLGVTSNGLVDALAFSPNGVTLAITADDESVRLWDLARGRPVGAALTGFDSAVTTIAFSSDGAALATGAMDGSIRLWDLLTYRQVGHPLTSRVRGGVSGIAYGRDGRTVAAASAEAVRLWNVALPADLAAAACANAGRSFTREEWERYVPQEAFREICH
ncbi:NACHT and WD repeat domain-containing protein [Actinomadura sp. 6N118]|uniref:NACHT and WD repeat domain-containing protein n=1 Tax=Actinomadura sp. 6N118 TaxID=3375151 RepID=UPI0037960547